MMFGINRCDVSKAAVNAMLVIPGVAAIRGNGGASVFGDTCRSRATAWQAMQIVYAIWRPWPTLPAS